MRFLSFPIYLLLILFFESTKIIHSFSFFGLFKKHLVLNSNSKDLNDSNNIQNNKFKILNLDRIKLTFDLLYESIQDKKLITITPGGLQGFYVLGICTYIKENYDLSNYVFSGASAGSWNSLFLSYKYDTKKIVDAIFDIDYEKAGSIFNVELMIKRKFLSNFCNNDFDLEKVYVGSTIFENFKFRSKVYNDFESLSDAIDCCMGSSHIPFVCGSLYFVYRDKITIDGGFSMYLNDSPYLPTKIPSLIINPNLFKKNISNNESVDLCEFYKSYFDSLDINKITNIKNMYEEGYQNAKDNKEALDEIFSKKLF